MNETIMASLAAAKSQKAKLHQARQSDFRSVRLSAGQKVKQVRKLKTTETHVPDTDTLHVMLGADVHAQLRAQSPEPAKLAQKIIREYLAATKT